jgi:hypothetical protein
MMSGHTALDWFPFGGRFRLSQQLVFGNNNRILATAVIPSGSTVTLNGQDYISSYTDPLHGSGRIDFHKVSPASVSALATLSHARAATSASRSSSASTMPDSRTSRYPSPVVPAIPTTHLR